MTMTPVPGDHSATVRAVIGVGPLSQPLSPTVDPMIQRVVVDQHLLLPDMFEITFIDDGTVLASSMITIGSEIVISGGAADSPSASTLIKGEVTSIEGDFDDNLFLTTVRGYDKSHRLQRAKRTRTFTDVSDGDIVRRVASEAQIDTGTIDDPGVTHPYVAQINQSDWDFLQQRAEEIGYEVVMSEGELNFRAASGSSLGGGGLAGAAAGAAVDAAAGALGLSSDLRFGDNLYWFKPRLSAANIVPEVEVRVWNPDDASVVVSTTDATSGTADISSDAGDMAGAFDGPFAGLPFSPPSIPFLPDLGPSNSDKAVVVVDRPVGWGSSASAAADALAAGFAEHHASTFAEAEGYARGTPAISAGASVDVTNVPEEFEGSWIVTQACHTFDDSEAGYHTHFTVSGRHERSLLGLSTGAATGHTRRLDGFVIGIVTNNNDDESIGRVKLSFPWLSPSFESEWARVVNVGAGKQWGAFFVPEVGDEVLVGFEFGDIRRPYVVGGLFNGTSEHPLLPDAVKAQGMSAQVVKHGIVSRLGNKLVFDDDEPTPNSPPPSVTASSVLLSDADEKVKVLLDKKSGELHIVCDSATPPGKIIIEQKGTGGSITVKAEGNLSLEAGSAGKVSIKGGLGVTLESGSNKVELGPSGTSITGQPTLSLN